MALLKQQIFVGSTGGLAVAPVESIAPTNPTAALDAAFADLGYITEDGVTFTVDVAVEDINAWQSLSPVRRIVTGRPVSIACSLQQWNRDTVGLALGGGTWATSGTPPNEVYTYTPPAEDAALPEYVAVLSLVDGDKHHRIVLYRGNVADTVETNAVRTAAAILPVTVSALSPDDPPVWNLISDDAAFAAA
jgi:hypothetical protein